MSDYFSAKFSDTHGNVNTGAGNQYNSSHYHFSLRESAGRSPRPQAVDDVRWLARRFAHPRGFGRASGILEAGRTVFLEAQPGSGRTATATMLLWGLRSGSETIRELLLERDTESPLNPNRIGEGELVWLDLSKLEGQHWAEANAELSHLRAVVLERTAYLVVVLPPTTKDLRPDLDRFRVPIEAPSPGDVLRHYLHTEGVPFPRPFPSLQFLNERRRPQEVTKYAQLITGAYERMSGRGGFSAWCVIAEQAWSGQAPEVARLVGDLRQGSQRALLLATAMLHGAHADTVHRAAASFMKAVEHPPDIRPMLLHTPLDKRLNSIDAEIDDSGGVRFRKLDYDSAVRAYLWAHMPELHGHIREWVGKTADSADLSAAERENLVQRFTEQCLHHRYLPMLVSLVEEWTSQSSSQRLAAAAALVLQRGLHDEQHDRFFRRMIYEWSCRSNLPPRLIEVIVVVCFEDMAVSHPYEALVRLHHVARREHGTQQARDALAELVNNDRRFLRQLVSRLTEAERNPERRKWTADVDLFLDLVGPDSLTDTGTRGRALVAERAMRGQLTDGWRLTFAQVSPERWRPQAQKWLTVAAENERFRLALLDVLVSGGRQWTAVLGQLYSIARGQGLRAISDLVLQKIDAAQGHAAHMTRERRSTS